MLHRAEEAIAMVIQYSEEGVGKGAEGEKERVAA
jgi:hypothetical protein